MVALVPILVIVAVVLAFARWQMRRGRVAGAEAWRRAPLDGPVTEKPATGHAGLAPSGFGGLAPDLARWVAAGVISADQADAIAALERGTTGRGGMGGERRVSLLAEALGYVGAVLALAGAGVGLGQSWEDLPVWARLGIPSTVTALLVLGGFLLRKQEEPAFRRLMSVLWALSVGTAGWALGVLGADVADLEEESVALLIGTGCSVLAASLWLARRFGFQQAALFASLHLLVISGILSLSADDSPPRWWFAAAVWLLGVTWAWLGWRDVIGPSWLAVALGCMGAVIGPALGLGDYEWLLAPALVTTGALMAMSIPTRQTPMLALGTVGAFGYITWAVVRYFKDSLGVPLALAIVGAVLLGLAVLAGRLASRNRGRGPLAIRVSPGAPAGQH